MSSVSLYLAPDEALIIEAAGARPSRNGVDTLSTRPYLRSIHSRVRPDYPVLNLPILLLCVWLMKTRISNASIL